MKGSVVNQRGGRPPRIVVTSVGAERLAVAGQNPARHMPLVPGGVCHAAALGEHATLCGLGTEALSWFPGLPFTVAEFLPRCGICLDRVRTASA